MGILPLKSAYVFGTEKGLDGELKKIQKRKTWNNSKASSTTHRRAMVFTLFEGQGILEEFEKYHWPDANQEKYDEYRSIAAKYPQLAFDLKNRALPELSKFDLVAFPNEIFQNVRTFNEELQGSASLERTISETRYWVFNQTDGIFAPSKFSGLAGINFQLYEQAVVNRSKRLPVTNFDGTTCRKAIEQSLGQKFRSDPELASMLEAWGNRTLGNDFFSGTDNEKWKFILITEHDQDEEEGYQQSVNHQSGLSDYESISIPDIPPKRSKPRVSSRKTSRTKPHRNPLYGAVVVKRDGYRCAVDNSHRSFETDDGNHYMEAHHIIPMQFCDDFELDIDHPYNIISLCPLCHKQIHLGKQKDKKKLAKILFSKMAKGLQHYNVSLEKVTSYYE